MIEIETLLEEMHQRGVSDLHLKGGRPPIFRINGQLLPQSKWPPLDQSMLQYILQQLSDEQQRDSFARNQELDFAYSLTPECRFRVNIGRQQGHIYFTLRAIRNIITTPDELGLPGIITRLTTRPHGLILVTGPTGSGKSTTLAAMIEHINQTTAKRIITIEDPIEYIFQDQQSIITQREIGPDTQSFAAALKYALRQDPDVIMVGEMRDLETIAATLTAAETGHLVLATLHTPSAPETIDRIVDVFPANQQHQIRIQLAMALVGVIAQRLILREDGTGRIAACEIMLGSSAIRNLIREGKTAQMISVIQTSREQGMQTLNQTLCDLYRRGHIRWEEAQAHTDDPEGLKQLLELPG